ncbi:hypothetical protein HOY80DRAFT_346155 [Tuber brumale]|nr:hypothetical protein HOY80DRAFT_346155 [Tuber brumale]
MIHFSFPFFLLSVRYGRGFHSSTARITMCFGVSRVLWRLVMLIPRFLSGFVVSQDLVSASVGEVRSVEDVLGPQNLNRYGSRVSQMARWKGANWFFGSAASPTFS